MIDSFRNLPKDLFPKRLSRDQVNQMMEDMYRQSDVNKDRLISYEEFLYATALKDLPKSPHDPEPEAKDPPKSPEPETNDAFDSKPEKEQKKEL